MQGQEARTKSDLPTIDQIEKVLAEAIGTPRLDELCLGRSHTEGASRLLHLSKTSAKVREALRSLGCDPDAVAEQIRQTLKNVPEFVISDDGFGPHCVAAGLLTLGAYAVLESQ